MLEDFLPHHSVQKELFRTEMENLALYGYGVKSFMLSMVETIGRVTDNRADVPLVNKAVDLGRELLNKPVEVFDGVEEILQSLNGDYRLVMATKGDLLDQERKLIAYEIHDGLTQRMFRALLSGGGKPQEVLDRKTIDR